MTIMAKTNMYDKYQTVIPKEIRKELGIKGTDYYIEWFLDEDGKLEVEFVKKLNFMEMGGRYKTEEPVNSVELKKNFKTGELK